jgi:uncharacterized protein
MKIAITGASGMIGNRLAAELKSHSLLALGRSAGRLAAGVRFAAWDPAAGPPPAAPLAGAEAVVHLAGEPVAQRWSEDAKRRIRESRVAGTRHLVEGLAQLRMPPRTLVCASAIGYYGSRGDEILTEQSVPGRGFLPEVCVAWEREADRAADLGIRVVKLRIGIVLAKEGGALREMLPAFRAGVGGALGSGRQWMSWIHVDDVTGLIRHAIESPALEGAVNATSPLPVSSAGFAKALGKTLRRPAILPVPGFALRILFGEMSEMLLGSQRVMPDAARASHYDFRYPELEAALAGLLAA